MSVHQPPSSYILKKLSEVTVPDHVSWFPQTIGWQILAFVLLAFIVYKSVLWLKRWWANRYRREALDVLLLLRDSQVPNQSISYEIFEVMKAVLVYIDPSHSNQFGDAFLQAIDSYGSDDREAFHSELGERWMYSLVKSKITLNEQEIAALFALCIDWLESHKDIKTANKDVKKGEDYAV
ncbi:DUF4381 family protein [Aliivibrio fischeri]|uniref:DUF4381 domain-containing protein n=1 Tax=Aliivibrio fischeri TaxID=668 RepID=UPI0012D9272F|nr:DUF4381 domain-containing protein [Aliivibrio fischeri]MUK63069.1 DUF4381 family protein [Aliivibrio fischeri]MUK69996.1 DUF4381 family protein [Aliivibrio fischeri]MUK72530.1 DUF4381 family protein [Aliivibrio fischeri]MUL20314.1 DUF4381 family protein [Aliivibrio fischeri]MUL24089.1 DUF4381 family protein [Aliivibrio fischeri]